MKLMVCFLSVTRPCISKKKLRGYPDIKTSVVKQSCWLPKKFCRSALHDSIQMHCYIDDAYDKLLELVTHLIITDSR